MAGRRSRHVGQPADDAPRPPLRPQRGARRAPHHARRRRADNRTGRVMRDEMATGAIPERAQALIDFWFGPPGDPDRETHRQMWFKSTLDYDDTLRRLFLADYELAAAGELAAWEAAPLSALALVLLLDQIPRNIFRDTPRAYATDPMARAAADRALA